MKLEVYCQECRDAMAEVPRMEAQVCRGQLAETLERIAKLELELESHARYDFTSDGRVRVTR